MTTKEMLYKALQGVIETFYQVVPSEYTLLPVSRYYHVTTTSSLKGDDRPLHKSSTYVIDIFTEDDDETLIQSIEESLYNSPLILQITSISSDTEEDIHKTTIQISIEE